MPTYGRPETAADYPFSTEAHSAVLRIKKLKESEERLRRERLGIKDCDHHWVPVEGTMGNLHQVAPGVIDAGYIHGEPFRATVDFGCRCTMCSTMSVSHVYLRCPQCMGEMRKRLATAEEQSFYRSLDMVSMRSGANSVPQMFLFGVCECDGCQLQAVGLY